MASFGTWRKTWRWGLRRAFEMANACVDKLKHDPNNVLAREKLARIFAERLHKPYLDIEQLHLLLNMPDQEAGRRAEWLGLVAAWQKLECTHRGD